MIGKMWFDSLLIVTCLLHFSHSHPHLSKEKQDIMSKCLEENSLTMEELEEGWKSGDIPEAHFCVHKCTSEKTGILKDDGKLQLEELLREKHIKEHWGEDMVEEITKCLQQIDKVEKCDDMRQVFDCFPNRADTQ